MTAIVTGADGFVGQRIVRLLSSKGETVLAVDRSFGNSETSVDATDGVRTLAFDVTSSEELSLPGGLDPTSLIHAAALTPTDAQELMDPQDILDVNLTGTVRMIEFARKARIRRFVFVSSSAVYSRPTQSEVEEASANGGATLYGSTKLSAELVVARYGDLFGIDVAIVRPSSIYGPGERWRASRPNVSTVFQLVQAAKSGATVQLKHPGSRREWTYVDDVANAVWRLLKRRRHRQSIFNVGSGDVRSLHQTARLVERLSGRPLFSEQGAVQSVVDGGPSWPVPLSSRRLEDETGWRPRVTLEDGIARYLSELGITPIHAKV